MSGNRGSYRKDKKDKKDKSRLSSLDFLRLDDIDAEKATLTGSLPEDTIFLKTTATDQKLTVPSKSIRSSRLADIIEQSKKETNTDHSIAQASDDTVQRRSVELPRKKTGKIGEGEDLEGSGFGATASESQSGFLRQRFQALRNSPPAAIDSSDSDETGNILAENRPDVLRRSRGSRSQTSSPEEGSFGDNSDKSEPNSGTSAHDVQFKQLQSKPQSSSVLSKKEYDGTETSPRIIENSEASLRYKKLGNALQYGLDHGLLGSDSESENNTPGSDGDRENSKFKQLKHIPSLSSKQKDTKKKLGDRFVNVEDIEVRGEARANKEALDKFLQEESIRRTQLTTQEYANREELMRQLTQKLEQQELLSEENKERKELERQKEKAHRDLLQLATLQSNEISRRPHLANKEQEEWAELMKQQRAELSQLQLSKLLEEEREARDKLKTRSQNLYNRMELLKKETLAQGYRDADATRKLRLAQTEDKKRINIAKKEQEEREELINAKNQLQLLEKEQELRLKLIEERQQEHALHQTSQVTASEKIPKAALETEQQKKFSQIESQLSHIKEEELRKAALRKVAEKATAQEKEKLAIKWAQQANKDIIQHVIENLQKSNKQVDLEKFTLFVQQCNNQPHTVLQIAIRDNRHDIVNIFLSNIAEDYNELKKQYIQKHCVCGLETTALHFAALYSNDGVGMMDLLIQHGADVTSEDKHNGSALILCLVHLGNYFQEPVGFIHEKYINNIVDSMRFLLKQGVKINNDLLRLINSAVMSLVQVNSQRSNLDALKSSVESLNDVISKAQKLHALITTDKSLRRL